MRPPKKTETIELRLPFETKQAFMARCQAAGVTASEALRGFIGDFVEARPARPRRGRHARWAAIGAGALLAAGALAQPALARAGASAGFAHLDADHDAVLSPAEFVAGAEVKLTLGSGPLAGTLPMDAALRSELLQAQFRRMDADHDGRVILAEFRRYRTTP